MLSSTLRTANIGSRFATRQILRRTQIPACAIHTSRKTKSAAAAVAASPSRFRSYSIDMLADGTLSLMLTN
jgi:hypothetical protein